MTTGNKDIVFKWIAGGLIGLLVGGIGPGLAVMFAYGDLRGEIVKAQHHPTTEAREDRQWVALDQIAKAVAANTKIIAETTQRLDRIEIGIAKVNEQLGKME